MSDEYYGFDDDDFAISDDNCDCAEEEWDFLDCTAKCWSCGNRRNLSTVEVDDYWKAQTQFERDMERGQWRDRLSQLWAAIRYRIFFWRRRAPYDLDDDIPF